MKDKEQLEIPIQPVEQPIICKPFEEPHQHWFYDTKNGTASLVSGRRPASYWYKSRRTGSTQISMFAEEEREDLPLVNLIRNDVRRWRKSNYEGATHVTKQLLAHWNREDRRRRLFFCQLEAVETIIYLREIFSSGKKTRWNTELSFEDYNRLLKNEVPSFVDEKLSQIPRLIDIPNEADMPGLIRYGCKMATGSGKTIVMAMLIAWSFCNKGRVPGDDRFTSAALVVCPNLTIKERLQVLRTDIINNYYEEFDIVPSQFLPELRKGKVLVTNWHQFAPESSNVESGKSYLIVNKGEEGAEAFAKRVLGDLCEHSPIMVLNDEAHHAYRPAQQIDKSLTAEEKSDLEEATVWISGLDRINKSVGVKFCVDLSATPFYIQGSGHTEGMPFPWLVSDFGLVDAIESGIVKIPRIPVSDTTGRPEPKFFALWKHVMNNLQPGEKFTSGKPKPDAVWRESQDAITTLASQWKEKFEYVSEASEGKDKTPPVMIVVCDNTDIAELFYRKISGEETVSVEDENDDEEFESEENEEPNSSKKKKKKKEKKVYGSGSLFPQLLSNSENFAPTLRIDSKLLAQAESEDPKASKKDAANQLREVVGTIGKLGKPGEQIRCVVSVQMLTEGWDANNVTQILGLRAFHSQLLCEQVVGRGLRRMDYTINPDGFFNPEYVDIYGVPFSVIPFRGRKSDAKAPEDKPLNHVRALEERNNYEIKFPIVEGYAFALKQNLIRANVEEMEKLVVEPSKNPTATFVKPQVYYEVGTPQGKNPFEYQEHDRSEYYESTHLQTIIFEISRRIVTSLTEGIGIQSAKLQFKSRQQLFPQVLKMVQKFVTTKIDFRGVDPREIGLEVYAEQVVERLMNAIEPDSSQGEPPLLPILNRYRQLGSTSEVNFKTVKRTVFTTRSHIDQVVCDTKTWEEITVFKLEQAKDFVKYYVRNDHLEFTIPYEYLGASHAYTPDFIVRLNDDSTLILEIKGQEDDQDRAKHEAAKRWVKAVNNWGKLGVWKFHVCHDPQNLTQELCNVSSKAREEYG